ncbi:DUF4034 domain-containing protein [Massilia antarctica]|uniref:DUF4034 domain-containing protein n=1 Tax=Massilia antarctica TaxID=2765360 RepID=A0AA48WH84_9BURK|nr:DUF4034 domain-containing protein [Massilia antarctica]QPI51399.1 DUF4034 domain-containing protein [Massilia antarctica]
MKRNWQQITIISAFSLAMLSTAQSVHACTQNNHIRPADVASDAVHTLLEEKNYKKLDELYKEYSKERAATPDGIAALSVFFKGIAQSVNICAKLKPTEEDWLAHQATLAAWIKSSPKSTGAKLALALSSVDYAWFARGNGVSSTVSPASRQLFVQRMDGAKRQFDKLAAVGKNNPAWYAGMLTIGLAQGWEAAKFDALYEKAVKLDPYYIDVHYTNIEYHAEKWYGSDEERDSAISRTADLTKERLGQTMYARLNWTVSESWSIFKNGNVSWERMKTGFEDYLNLFSDPRTRNGYAMYACLANDRTTLKQQLDLLGEQANQKAWGNNYKYAYCTALAKMVGIEKVPKCFKFDNMDEYDCD